MGRAICWGVVLLGIGVSAPANAGVPISVVINEVDYDQVATDRAEFVELKNVSGVGVDLTTFSIELRSDTAGTLYETFTLDPVILPPGGYYVICGDAANVANCDLDVSPDANLIQNGTPEVVVLLDGAAIIDVLSYGGSADLPYREGTGAGADDPNVGIQSLSRFPDGQDTNDNSVDFSKRCSTPGATNAVDTVCTPVCDNGVVEPGEECDAGPLNGDPASCCDALCAFVAVDTACGSATVDDCTLADTCNGAGVCDANDVGDGTSCTDDGFECTNDICGSGVCTHPALGSGTACGSATVDDCTLADTCDGAGACDVNDVADDTGCTDDGVECTNDICGSGVCTHPALGSGVACGSATVDDCTLADTCDGAGACDVNDVADDTGCTDDGLECTNDICGSGVCTHPALGSGVACGSATVTDCTLADTCDGAGVCDVNDVVSDTACGSSADDDCLNPDTCDGSGTCESNDESDGTGCTSDGEECTDDICGSGVCTHPALGSGTACGSSSDDDCLNPDTCDGSGTCESNDESDGTGCTSDGEECTDDVCGSGVCTHASSASGSACGSSSSTDCSDPDTCDGSGDCQANDATDGASCADNGQFCDGDESCDSGECVGAGDPCDTSVETCNEADNVCDRPACGDGVVAEDEQCDDFNFDDGDGCTNCRVDRGWVCGDDTPTDGVSDCYETCGNGALDAHEGCDDANVANGDGCSDICSVEDGYECVEGAAGADACTPVCGDGIVLEGERCDDGNVVSDDGCTGCAIDTGYFCDSQEPSVCAVFEPDTGCSCRLGAGSRGGWAASVLLLAVLALRRRRRAR